MQKILVVEDERPIAEIIRFNLEKEGYKVMTAFDGAEAVDMALAEKPDLMVLDIMLPKLNGFEVCQRVRQVSNIPILMLTAKEDEADKVHGLALGADDYVTKPFSPRELVARIKAQLRRQAIAGAGEEQLHSLKCGDLELNLERFEVKRNGEVLALTVREFELLKFLAINSGQVYDRADLLREVWGYEYLGDVRTVDVTIRRLREKIEEDPSNPRYIMTKRGYGYFFERE